jgi:predicted acetyltransferase
MPKTLELTIKGVESEEELRRAQVLMTGLNHPPYIPSTDWLLKYSEQYPRFQREHTRIVVVNDEVVAALRISTDIARIGEARLKVGGLGWIAKGMNTYADEALAALIAESLAYLKEHRYHLSIVFSHSPAMMDYGFIHSLNDNTLHIPTSEIRHPTIPKECVRAIKPGDIPFILHLHSLKYAKNTCSILREYSHMSIKWSVFKHSTVFTNPDGKIQGYVLAFVERNQIHVYEAVAHPDALYNSILAHCKSLATEHLTSDVIFHLPYEHAMTRYLNNCLLPTETVHNAGTSHGLMRIVDLEETLESMVPEWEHRIHHSLLREMHCEVTLVIDGQPCRIRIHYGVLDIAQQMGKNKLTLSLQTFTKLLTGYEHLGEIWNQDRRLINREGKALLEVLFPKRNPYITPFDRY